MRAARLLQERSGIAPGCDIALEKNLPVGGGLGGGSSDAATTLLVLNRLWDLNLRRGELMELGCASAPTCRFFCSARTPWARASASG